MIVFRVCDARFPFLWLEESLGRQRPARWHGLGDGPVQYFADTPDGAWAELLRHEEITERADLEGLRARVWAVEIGDHEAREPHLSRAELASDPDGYETCRAEARRLRNEGAIRLVAPSAALKSGEAAGYRSGGSGLQRAPRRDGKVIVHFGALPEAEGWCAAEAGRPLPELLGRVRPFGSRDRA